MPVESQAAHSVDDILVREMQQQGQDNDSVSQFSSTIAPRNMHQSEELSPQQEELSPSQQETSHAYSNIPSGNQVDSNTTTENQQETHEPNSNQEQSPSSNITPKNNKNINSDNSSNSDNSPIDEYGNPIERPKLYTQEEVQAMIRDRLSRGRFAEQQPHVQQHTKQQPVEGDETTEEDWQVQLNRVIDTRLEERQREVAERQWREQERAKQEQFQEKFTSGMNRYSDFRDVVAGKPITDDMMLATRSLDNPAAFVYGAAKLHPQELERISRIADPHVQAAEVGRLHERMVKERKAATSAPKPIESPKSDLTGKPQPTSANIDHRIQQHANQKFSYRKK